MSYPIYGTNQGLGSGEVATLGGQMGRAVSSTVSSIAYAPAQSRPQIINRGAPQFMRDAGIDPAIITQIKANPQGVLVNAGLRAGAALFDNMVNGDINPSNAHIFSSPELMSGMYAVNPGYMNGAIGNGLGFLDLLGLQSVFMGRFGAQMFGYNIRNTGGYLPAYEPYAHSFWQGNVTPKYKFLFLMMMDFEPGYDHALDRNFVFLVQAFQRPNISIEYDDVNMYNFRTKVAKKTVYEPVTVSFIDDNKNQSMQMLTMIMRALSPIFNVKDPSADIEHRGMDFSEVGDSYRGVSTNSYAGSLGPLQTQDVWSDLGNYGYGDIQGLSTPIKRIRLYHVYDFGRRVNVYNFFRPRVMSFQMDPLDMADDGRDGSKISLQFAYDALYIDEGLDSTEDREIIEATFGRTLITNPRENSRQYSEPRMYIPPASAEGGFGSVVGQRLPTVNGAATAYASELPLPSGIPTPESYNGIVSGVTSPDQIPPGSDLEFGPPVWSSTDAATSAQNDAEYATNNPDEDRGEVWTVG